MAIPKYVEEVSTFLPIDEKGLYTFPIRTIDWMVVWSVIPTILPTVAPLFGPRFEAVFGPTERKGMN